MGIPKTRIAGPGIGLVLKCYVAHGPANEFKRARSHLRLIRRDRSPSCSWTHRAVRQIEQSPQGATPSCRSGDHTLAERGKEGEKSGPVEGRGRCRAILSRSSVAPLDVLMHVENNLTANLLHSFSFLPRASRLAAARRTYWTLPFVPSPTRERALLRSPRRSSRPSSFL